MPRNFDAILFDRDGTLIRDVPYNGSPGRVVPLAGVGSSVAKLRAAGYSLAVVSNQSGIGRGLLSHEQVQAVNSRVEALLGPFDSWRYCPHTAAESCFCRKPKPGMILQTAKDLGVAPHRCLVIGDIGADVTAAEAAGATGLLVPTLRTQVGEIAAATNVAGSMTQAAQWIFSRENLLRPAEPAREPGARILAVRSDSAGDVIQMGPALQALASQACSVSLIAGPGGADAARLLPAVGDVFVWPTPWIAADPPKLTAETVEPLLRYVRRGRIDEAVIFTSFHQSPLPMALLLRLAGVNRISAISEDYPGSLLDVRHRVPDGIPEAERALSLAAAAGYALPPGDDGRLRLAVKPRERQPAHVVLHPGAMASARAIPPATGRAIVSALTAAGLKVRVTGSSAEQAMTAEIAGSEAENLGGLTTMRELAEIIAEAGCLVSGNTGPAHVAAAMGTPVVSMFAPTVPFAQWAPYAVPRIRLGNPEAPCAGSRAFTCEQPGHPCLAQVRADEVLEAVQTLLATV